MRKPATWLAALLLVAALAPAGAQTLVPTPPQLSAKGYLLMDFRSGRLLAARNHNERLDPASITKLMTAYAAFRALGDGSVSLDDKVLVSEKAWRTGGSRMFIEVGTRVSIEDLLQGMIVQSGNDASVALAEHLAGTEETFAQLMNNYAQELGMLNSRYTNATGLTDQNHYTSAADIARLATAIIREFPQYYRWYSQKEFTYNGITQKNRNALLWRDDSVDGMKTGHTESAGYCLVSSAERDGMRLIAVVLGTDSSSARANDSQALLNFGFRFFETRKLYAAGDDVTATRIWKGATEALDLGVTDDVWVTIPRGSFDELDATINVPSQILAPVRAGDRLGTVRVRLAADTVAEAPLVALGAVDRGTLWQRAKDSVLMFFD